MRLSNREREREGERKVVVDGTWMGNDQNRGFRTRSGLVGCVRDYKILGMAEIVVCFPCLFIHFPQWSNPWRLAGTRFPELKSTFPYNYCGHMTKLTNVNMRLVCDMLPYRNETRPCLFPFAPPSLWKCAYRGWRCSSCPKLCENLRLQAEIWVNVKKILLKYRRSICAACLLFPLLPYEFWSRWVEYMIYDRFFQCINNVGLDIKFYRLTLR